MLGTTIYTTTGQDNSLYVRLKELRGRRYAYLVEGIRDGKRVQQRTICYLGPISRLAVSGVPSRVRDRLGDHPKLDWNSINDKIIRIPLRFEELSLVRGQTYLAYIGQRRQGFRSRGERTRAEGELAGLAKLAKLRFEEMFEEVGEREYRMR
jgi:hypothetical protein